MGPPATHRRAAPRRATHDPLPSDYRSACGRGSVWQITAIDTYSSYAWADLVSCPDGAPGVKDTSKLARRIAREPQGRIPADLVYGARKMEPK